MWAPTIAVDRGAVRVGIRPSTARVARRVHRHLGDTAIDDPQARSNYSVLGPVWRRLRPGRLMRNGHDVATSWRLSTLLARLDAELAGVGPVPERLLRARCDLRSNGDGVNIVGPEGRPALTARWWWIDPRRVVVVDPATGHEQPLSGVDVGVEPLGFEWLSQLETHDDDGPAWIELLTELAGRGRINVIVPSADSATVAPDA